MPDSDSRRRKTEELAKGNPQVDVDQLREAQDLLEELRRAGVSPQQYGINSPYQRKPARTRLGTKRSD